MPFAGAEMALFKSAHGRNPPFRACSAATDCSATQDLRAADICIGDRASQPVNMCKRPACPDSGASVFRWIRWPRSIRHWAEKALSIYRAIYIPWTV